MRMLARSSSDNSVQDYQHYKVTKYIVNTYPEFLLRFPCPVWLLLHPVPFPFAVAELARILVSAVGVNLRSLGQNLLLILRFALLYYIPHVPEEY